MKSAAAEAPEPRNEKGRPATGRPLTPETISSTHKDTITKVGPQFAPSALALALMAFSSPGAAEVQGKRMNSARRAIAIMPVGSLFDVVVEPRPDWPGMERHGLSTHRAAKRAADSLAIVHGWRVIDRTPKAMRGAA